MGFGITPSSAAAQDLRQIATQTGGVYHHAADANQLADVFMEFVDTFSVIDMLGTFGKSPSGPASVAADPATETINGTKKSAVGQEGQLDRDDRRVQGAAADPEASNGAPPVPALWGALAIDSKQGPSWGWAIDYPTVQAAERRVLSECGEDCHVVMTFSGECAALAADQTQDSTVFGWAKHYDDSAGAQNRAMDECRQRGGTSCLVRVWGCTRR